jgi:uncharacterized protein YajQ (UPF0234 family)
MGQFSFDIVCYYDKAEVTNVYEQTKREISNRYDFKGTPAAIDWLDGDRTGVKLTGNSQYQIDAITDLLRKKLAARGQSQKLLDTSEKIVEANLKATKDIKFKSGLSQDNAKTINKAIQNAKLKVKTQIQGDLIRVSSASKDELQEVMNLIKAQDYDYPLRFINYR